MYSGNILEIRRIMEYIYGRRPLIVVKWLEFIFHVHEGMDSVLGPDTGYCN
jgi:hypothetical protein